MKNKAKFITAVRTLLFSWGGDTPAEAVWATNELLEWYEAEYSVTLGIRLDVEVSNFDEVIAAIEVA